MENQNKCSKSIKIGMLLPLEFHQNDFDWESGKNRFKVVYTLLFKRKVYLEYLGHVGRLN